MPINQCLNIITVNVRLKQTSPSYVFFFCCSLSFKVFFFRVSIHGHNLMIGQLSHEIISVSVKDKLVFKADCVAGSILLVMLM